MTKKCNKCGEIKSVDDFRKDSTLKSKISNTCRICARKYDKYLRSKNKQKIASYRKWYYENIESKKIDKKERLDRWRLWAKNNKEHLRQYSRENSKKQRATMSRGYINQLLKQRGIPKEYIVLIYAIIVAKRAIKNNKE